MNGAVKKAIGLMEVLPESEQNFALEFIRRLVLAWDPDFTKVTLEEGKELEEAERDMADKSEPFDIFDGVLSVNAYFTPRS